MSDTQQDTLTDREQEQWKELVHNPHEDLSDKQVTSKVKLSIKRRFSSPEWVRLYEYTAPNGRRADCIAVNTMPSRNFKVVGFEFKASRSDWLSELKDTEKADHFVQIVDEWYVVAGDTGIVKESELPDGWGLLELKPNSEQLWKLEDSDLTEYQTGEPDRRFWATFLKKTVGSESNYSEQDLREARSRGYEEAKSESRQAHLSYDEERLVEKAESFDAIKEAGLYIHPPVDEERIERLKLAERVVEKLQSDGFQTLEGRLNSLKRSVVRNHGDVWESIDELEDQFEAIRGSFESEVQE